MRLIFDIVSFQPKGAEELHWWLGVVVLHPAMTAASLSLQWAGTHMDLKAQLSAGTFQLSAGALACAAASSACRRPFTFW